MNFDEAKRVARNTANSLGIRVAVVPTDHGGYRPVPYRAADEVVAFEPADRRGDAHGASREGPRDYFGGAPIGGDLGIGKRS